jgi:hypothetical protein
VPTCSARKAKKKGNYGSKILWHIYPLLGNDRKTNEIKALARQQLLKYATVLEPLLGSGLRATMEVLLEAVFSVWSTSRLHHTTSTVALRVAEVTEREVANLRQ